MLESFFKVINLSVSLLGNHNTSTILKDVSFELASGETLAIVGESGSGKTITALAIMQLLPLGFVISQLSTILLNQQDLLTFSELKMRRVRGKKIALIFQEAITALNPVLTIGEQIIEVLDFHFKLSSREARQKALALLKEVGVPSEDHYLKSYPHQLSGGLKQRAMIAIALAGEPDLLIADEPTTALDVTLQAQIIKLLKAIQKKRNMGLIFITHDLGIVYKIADKVIVLYRGEVVESASAEVFFSSAKHPYSLKLFNSLPGWIQKPEKKEWNKQSQPLLKVAHLKVYYPLKKGMFKRKARALKAVDNISLEMYEGRTLALVGESGSGKTTTGMAILKLVRITGGQILFNGYDLAQLNTQQTKKFRSQLQVVFQDPYGSMNPRLSVGEIIAEGISTKRGAEKKRIDHLLECVGLDPNFKHRYPHEFSGGQRQRICIARALAVEPKLLICDEPTSALDVTAQMQILQLLQKLQNEMGLSYLLITHNIAVVDFMADDVAVMHRGKIVECGPALSILHHPSHPYTQQLLGAVLTVPKNNSMK